MDWIPYSTRACATDFQEANLSFLFVFNWFRQCASAPCLKSKLSSTLGAYDAVIFVMKNYNIARDVVLKTAVSMSRLEFCSLGLGLEGSVSAVLETDH